MRRFLALAAALAVPALAPAQTTPAAPAAPAADERPAVLAVVRGLFDAMRKGDSAAVRAAFAPDAQLMTMAVRRDGTPAVMRDSIDAFARAVGTPHAEVWDERLTGEEVRVDGTLATVWTRYDFYLGSTFSHCGVDAFMLAKLPAGWKIVSLADTRRKQGCGK